MANCSEHPDVELTPHTFMGATYMMCSSCLAANNSIGQLIRHSNSKTITELIHIIKTDNDRWWRDLHTGEPFDRNVGEMLCLIHSEISEALEGHRKGLMDDHLPHLPMYEVELADAFIRLLDLAAHTAPNFEQAIYEKLEYNRRRKDHTNEARKAAGGKKY